MRDRVVADDEPKPLGNEAEDTEYRPRVPDCSMEDDEVENLEVDYSDRAPTDYVVSGPLGDTVGPGQRFSSVAAALIWLTRRIGGERIKKRIVEAEPTRWAFLVKKASE